MLPRADVPVQAWPEVNERRRRPVQVRDEARGQPCRPEARTPGSGSWNAWKRLPERPSIPLHGMRRWSVLPKVERGNFDERDLRSVPEPEPDSLRQLRWTKPTLLQLRNSVLRQQRRELGTHAWPSSRSLPMPTPSLQPRLRPCSWQLECLSSLAHFKNF